MFFNFSLLFLTLLVYTVGKCSNNDSKGKSKLQKKTNEKCLTSGKVKDKGEKKCNTKNANSNLEPKKSSSNVKKEDGNTDKANLPLQVNTGNVNVVDVEKPIDNNKDQPPVINNGAIDPDIKNSKIQKIMQGETKDPDDYPTLADAGDGFDKNQTIEQNIVNVSKINNK